VTRKPLSTSGVGSLYSSWPISYLSTVVKSGGRWKHRFRIYSNDDTNHFTELAGFHVSSPVYRIERVVIVGLMGFGLSRGLDTTSLFGRVIDHIFCQTKQSCKFLNPNRNPNIQKRQHVLFQTPATTPWNMASSVELLVSSME